jgi:Spy/CpxP family protein refolding chaperone
MNRNRLILAALGLALAAGTAPAVLGAPQETALRPRLRESLSDLYLVRLTRALELTEDQAARLYPVLTRAEKDKAALQGRMGNDLRDLREELAGPAVREGRVAELVDRVREARRAIRQKEDEVEAVLEAHLTPVQRARYVIFTVDFMRSVGENLQRVRGQRGVLKRIP